MNRKLKISLYLAAIFVAGIVTGIFISYQVARHMAPNRERMARGWCHELQSRLNLTPQQMDKIRPIIDRTMLDFTRNLSQQMLSSLSNCNAQVALELTPDQKVKLDQLQQEKENFIRTHIGEDNSGLEKKP